MPVTEITTPINQIAAVANKVVQLATGQTGQGSVTSANWVSMATIALSAGYDQVTKAISTVLSDTIFSSRSYDGKFKGLMVDAIRWGNHVRKITAIAGDFEDSQYIELTDGASIDQYKVRKPKVLQMNFYNESTYTYCQTIYDTQLDVAFRGPDEFAAFLAMVYTEVNNHLTQTGESLAKNLLANHIAAQSAANTGNIIHLRTEYYTARGIVNTEENPGKVTDWADYYRFAFGRMKTISQAMTERSVLYHMNPTGNTIYRHTPVEMQKLYMFAPTMNEIAANTLSMTWHPDYLKLIDYEEVNWWQAPETPDAVTIIPTYMNANGTVTTATAASTVSNIMGVLFDEEALGITIQSERQSVTPYNAAGEYVNVFWRATRRYWADMTENFVVFCDD